jgi:hypothetical protein
MAAVAESLDRGVLFVPHLDRMVALGAFGNTGWGAPLAKTTQGLIMAIGSSGVFKDCVSDSRRAACATTKPTCPRPFSKPWIARAPARSRFCPCRAANA